MSIRGEKKVKIDTVTGVGEWVGRNISRELVSGNEFIRIKESLFSNHSF